MTKIKAVTLIAAGIVLANSTALFSAPELRETRDTLKAWVELKKTTSEESSKWRVEKELLSESIELLDSEIAKLKEQVQSKIDEASAADIERSKLTEQEKELKMSSAVVAAVISDIEGRVLELLKYFPASTQKKLSVITEQIPTDERAAAKLGLSVRVQNVVGILTEFEKFNRQISYETAMQNINGANVEVRTIYLGLSVGYYVDGTRSEAGILTPAKGGWIKEPRNDLANVIANAIAMQQREATADFVNLPITIK